MKSNPELVRIFSALTDEQMGNVRHHLQRGTRILCGALAHLFAKDGAG